MGKIKKIKKKIDDGSWPYCKTCRSYHAPENPTCFKYRGKEFGTVTEQLTKALWDMLKIDDWSDEAIAPKKLIKEARAALCRALTERPRSNEPW